MLYLPFCWPILLHLSHLLLEEQILFILQLDYFVCIILILLQFHRNVKVVLCNELVNVDCYIVWAALGEDCNLVLSIFLILCRRQIRPVLHENHNARHDFGVKEALVNLFVRFNRPIQLLLGQGVQHVIRLAQVVNGKHRVVQVLLALVGGFGVRVQLGDGNRPAALDPLLLILQGCRGILPVVSHCSGHFVETLAAGGQRGGRHCFLLIDGGQRRLRLEHRNGTLIAILALRGRCSSKANLLSRRD